MMTVAPQGLICSQSPFTTTQRCHSVRQQAISILGANLETTTYQTTVFAFQGSHSKPQRYTHMGAYHRGIHIWKRTTEVYTYGGVPQRYTHMGAYPRSIHTWEHTTEVYTYGGVPQRYTHMGAYHRGIHTWEHTTEVYTYGSVPQRYTYMGAYPRGIHTWEHTTEVYIHGSIPQRYTYIEYAPNIYSHIYIFGSIFSHSKSPTMRLVLTSCD